MGAGGGDERQWGLEGAGTTGEAWLSSGAPGRGGEVNTRLTSSAVVDVAGSTRDQQDAVAIAACPGTGVRLPRIQAEDISAILALDPRTR
ncbi:MAG: hypothetical protein R2849_12835 [Thermomicrobiales bacterium]